ncbi:MAG: hemolysin family protein [Rhodothermales bacterium]
MGLLIAFVLLALGVSFLCSIMEAVLLSVTPSFLEMKVKDGSTTAKRLQDLKKDIDRPLAAILSLNTVAHTVGAAGAGAQAVIVFGDAVLGIFSAILTLLILVLSEIIPKTLGALYWRKLAPAVTRTLIPTIWITWPLVKLSQGITRLLARGRKVVPISREELTAMAELGEEQGVFEAGESRIIRNLFRFSSLRVKDIMTPRIVMFALPESQTVREVVDEYEEFRFSRIPIYTETRDDVTGYVLTDEILLKAAQENGDIPLSELKRDMLVVPDSLHLHELFERMLDGLEHIALVVDEYGGVEGVVSMEDIVETLLGLEIVDEADSAEDMQVLARRQWLARARRLGIVPKDLEKADEKELESVLKFGLTGGQQPRGASDDSSGRGEDDGRSSSESHVDERLTDSQREGTAKR